MLLVEMKCVLQAEGFLIVFLRALDQLIFLDHRFSSFFEVVYIDTGRADWLARKRKNSQPISDQLHCAILNVLRNYAWLAM
jgi:hypothetical protein